MWDTDRAIDHYWVHSPFLTDTDRADILGGICARVLGTT
jgi:hypothetical protein